MSSTSLLIPAAGRSQRFGGDTNKLLLTLDGDSILRRTLQAFDGVKGIRELILIYGPATRAAVLEEANSGRHPFLEVQAVEGGDRRQDSVANGLAAASAQSDLIMIHDAARPFVSRAAIEAAIAAAAQYGGASVGIPVADTIKQVGNGNTVEKTLDRTVLWQTQTPQVFQRAILEQAIAYARDHQIESNDEAELVERAGHTVVMVAGSPRNLKITTPGDLAIARALGPGDSA